jgi:alkylated DNA repair dioxygenase AlkB
MRHGTQDTLFDMGTTMPTGLVYRPNFLTEFEEQELLYFFDALPLKHPLHEGVYAAKRRVMSFGWGFDYRYKKLVPGPPLPRFLVPMQQKIAKWLDIPQKHVVEALITEYTPGSAIGWHRDNETFDSIIGISLAGWCNMRFRPIKSKQIGKRKIDDIVALDLEPRSAYIMQDKIRWEWQHSVPKVETLRYSITFRTLPKGYVLPRN